MRHIILIITTSFLLLGCNQDSPNNGAIKKLEVSSVTVIDPGEGGILKTYNRSENVSIFIESDENWLEVTKVAKFKFGKKETTTDHYKPETLVKFSTGDWY